MKYLKSRVHLPFGERYSVETITSNAEHLGNRVADGDLHPSMFWPELARIEHTQRVTDHRKMVDARKRKEQQAYAQNWVARWLQDSAL